MRIALTGATGFIGHRLLARLKQTSGWDLLCLSRRPVEGTEWRPWSLGSTIGETEQALRGIQAVCHLAAYLPANMADLDEAERCFRENALATSRLLQAAKQAGVERFLYCSSANVLARHGDDPVSEEAALGCEHAPAYLGSKVMGEIFANSARTPAFRVAIARPSSVYGPGMPGKGALVHFARRLRAGQSVQIDNPSYQADYVWVGDVVGGLSEALGRGFDGTVNLGSGVATSLKDLARQLCDVLALPYTRIEEAVATPAMSRGFPALDIRRAQAVLDYRPTELARGLREWLASVS